MSKCSAQQDKLEIINGSWFIGGMIKSLLTFEIQAELESRENCCNLAALGSYQDA